MNKIYQTISNKASDAYQTGMNILKSGVMAGALALPAYQVANAQELRGDNFNRVGVELSIPFGEYKTNNPQLSLTLGEQRRGLEGVIGNSPLLKLPLTGTNGVPNMMMNWKNLSDTQKIGVIGGIGAVAVGLALALNKNSDSTTTQPAPTTVSGGLN